MTKAATMRLNDDLIIEHQDWNRFWGKVDATGDCWEWEGSLSRKGYGVFSLRGLNRKAHRVGWVSLVADIPEGLQIDHLCRNTGCVNPDHLEPVTPQENYLRGIRNGKQRWRYCKRGHPLFGANLYVPPRGTRTCRTCQQARNRKSVLKRKVG